MSTHTAPIDPPSGGPVREADEPVPHALGVDALVSAVEGAAGAPASAWTAASTPAQWLLVGFGAIALLYVARPVALPVFLACMAGMTLKPVIRWASGYHIPRALSAAFLLVFLMAAAVFGFSRLGRPAMVWMKDAPQHMTDLRQRVQKLVPRMASFNKAAAAVNNLGATEAEQRAQRKQSPTVEVSDSHGTASVLNWTGALLMGVGETLVLLYLLLASGDLFTQKLVHVMPTLSDKKRAVEISREIEHGISKYLLSVTLINAGLGVMAGVGLHFMEVPNAAMWGMVVAVLNYVPYFGPFVGVLLLSAVGLLAFDSVWRGLLPPGWYLLLHALESNFITPILLGRRFTLNPVVIFISLIFWTWLWGVPGALMSVPILVSIKVLCDRVAKLSSVSELLTS